MIQEFNWYTRNWNWFWRVLANCKNGSLDVLKCYPWWILHLIEHGTPKDPLYANLSKFIGWKPFAETATSMWFRLWSKVCLKSETKSVHRVEATTRLPSMAAINGRCRDTSSRESTSRSVDGAECMQSLATVATMATRCNLMQLFRECCNPVGFATSRQGTRSFPRWSRVCPAKQVVGNSNVSWNSLIGGKKQHQHQRQHQLPDFQVDKFMIRFSLVSGS